MFSRLLSVAGIEANIKHAYIQTHIRTVNIQVTAERTQTPSHRTASVANAIWPRCGVVILPQYLLRTSRLIYLTNLLNTSEINSDAGCCAAACLDCRRSWVTTTPRRWVTSFEVGSASTTPSLTTCRKMLATSSASCSSPTNGLTISRSYVHVQFVLSLKIVPPYTVSSATSSLTS